MELTEIASIMWAIHTNMQRGREYTFDKIVAILYANDLDVDTYRAALALQKGLDRGLFAAINVVEPAEGAVTFSLS